MLLSNEIEGGYWKQKEKKLLWGLNESSAKIKGGGC